MIVQYAIAGDTKGVVLGSDHAAESVTGFIQNLEMGCRHYAIIPFE